MTTGRNPSIVDSHPVLKKSLNTVIMVLGVGGGAICFFSRDIIYMAIGLGLFLIAGISGSIAYYIFDIDLFSKEKKSDKETKFLI